eukprot:CAMPEP_0174260198 /NCGR_PEP_ID=MMETSP0439-20130205/9211_1 /TAXON_ID=0 /ORGANISM="Stereomyxa ramosa, Strain Chinc5" /LENGTH=781 /DNA_ID=CAMNT_0015344391 /DNA_START=28 /DNA_END=2370 /DNA_ORIENTATION=+
MGNSSSRDALKASWKALREENIPINDERWQNLWLFSGLDIFALIPPDEIRLLKFESPRNLAILFNKIIAQMREVVAKGNDNTQEDFNHVRNCIRLASRLLPFVMEDQSDDFLERVFWANEIPKAKQVEGKQQPKEEKEKEKEESENSGESEGEENAEKEEKKEKEKVEADEPEEKSAKGGSDEENEEGLNTQVEDANEEPLAIRFLNALVNLLFFPGFTISRSKKTEDLARPFLPPNQVWVAGIGVEKVLPSSAVLDSNRNETLKCLLVLFSEAMYRSPEESDKYVNKWLDLVATNESYHSAALFYSLLNTSCTYDPIGWGVPYNHYLFNDYKEGLAGTCMQVLIILLNHLPSPLIPRNPATKVRNVFVDYLKSIQSTDTFKFLYTAIVELLNNPLMANSTYLPGSKKEVRCHREMLMLFWKLIQENDIFFRWLLSKGDITLILGPLLHYLHEGRKDTTQEGLIHLGTFTLLFMSGEREFCVQLNKPYDKTPTIRLPTFTGNYADYLILVFHKLLVDGHAGLESLHECLLAILANVSPYIKSLSMVTSVKLMNLFKNLSRKKFLFANPRNYRYLFFMMEIFNNCIQYQYEGNYHLVYTMVRDQKAFVALSDLSLDGPEDKPKVETDKDQEEDQASEGSEDVKDKEKEDKEKEEKEDQNQQKDKEKETEQEQENTQDSGSEKIEDSSAVPITKQTEEVFIPTEEWLHSWKDQIQINTILRLLSAIVPNIPKLVNGSSSDEASIIAYIKSTTMVGILPVPHPILIRRYQDNVATNMWFTTFMW